LNTDKCPTTLGSDLEIVAEESCAIEQQELLYRNDRRPQSEHRPNPYLQKESLQQEMMCVLWMKRDELKEVMQTLSLTSSERRRLFEAHGQLDPPISNEKLQLFYARLLHATRLYENEQPLTASQADLLMLVQYAKIVRVVKDLTSSHGQSSLNLIASLIASPSRKQAASESLPERRKHAFRNEEDITRNRSDPPSPFCFMRGMPLAPTMFLREVNRINEETKQLQGEKEPRIKFGKSSPATSVPLSPVQPRTPNEWKWASLLTKDCVASELTVEPEIVSCNDSNDFQFSDTDEEEEMPEPVAKAEIRIQQYQQWLAASCQTGQYKPIHPRMFPMDYLADIQVIMDYYGPKMEAPWLFMPHSLLRENINVAPSFSENINPLFQEIIMEFSKSLNRLRDQRAPSGYPKVLRYPDWQIMLLLQGLPQTAAPRNRNHQPITEVNGVARVDPMDY